MDTFNVMIICDKGFNDYRTLKLECDKALSKIVLNADINVFASKGFDSDELVTKYADECGFGLEVFPMLREHYSKYAHYVRDEEMLKKADALIAFHDGYSFITGHLIQLSVKRGLQVVVINYLLN